MLVGSWAIFFAASSSLPITYAPSSPPLCDAAAAGVTSSVSPDGLPPSPPGKAYSVEGGEDGAYVIGSELDAAKKIAQLPTSMQARYNGLPKTAQRALIK